MQTTPPSPLSLHACRRRHGVRQVPVPTSKMMSSSMTASSNHNMSSDEITLDRYLEIVFRYLVCKTITHGFHGL